MAGGRDLRLSLWPVTGLPEIRAGDDLSTLLSERAIAQGLVAGDVLVVAHKPISKAEGRVIALAAVTPGAAARALAERTGKDARLCELILAESRRIVAERGGTVITETRHGFVCANAGIDASNVVAGSVVLLPIDPDRSARTIQRALAAAVGGWVGVVVMDTHGRAFRRGLVNVAIGVAGIDAIVDERGGHDRDGRLLRASDRAVADELAAAAGLCLTKASGTPAVVVAGASAARGPGAVADLIRDRGQDLFRGAPAAGAEPGPVAGDRPAPSPRAGGVATLTGSSPTTIAGVHD